MTDAEMPANPFPGLPDAVFQTMVSAVYTEVATLTAQGMPIDTPTYCFASGDGSSLDVATGLAYPVKAERARRNPKVGLFLEAGGTGPAVCVAALAAVRDGDFTANAQRYIAETAAYVYQLPWSKRREAVWYWTRLIVECHPYRIMWWPSRAAMDEPPQVWRAPSGKVFPKSDPAPASPNTAAPAWEQGDWREVAQGLVQADAVAHVSAVDDEGFPLPILARRVSLNSDGFDVDLPRGRPWALSGRSSLTYAGRATFLGEIEPGPAGARLRVERMLPVLPMVKNPEEVFEPAETTRAQLMQRLAKELERRGAAFPQIPELQPEPTTGSLRRRRALEQMWATMRVRQGDDVGAQA